MSSCCPPGVTARGSPSLSDSSLLKESVSTALSGKRKAPRKTKGSDPAPRDELRELVLQRSYLRGNLPVGVREAPGGSLSSGKAKRVCDEKADLCRTLV